MFVGRGAGRFTTWALRRKSPDLLSQAERAAVPVTSVPASVNFDLDHDNDCTQRLIDQFTANGRSSRSVPPRIPARSDETRPSRS